MTGRLEHPDWFTPEHRQVWTDTVARLTDDGGLFRADPHVLTTYVCAYIDHAKAAKLAIQTGPLLIRKGQPVPNPALAEQRRAADALAKASRALGLGKTPKLNALAESPMQRLGARWCDEHDRWECKHPCKHGAPCHAYSLIKGTASCRMHVGLSIDKAREKGERELAKLYATEVDIGPAAALLREVRWAAGHVDGLRAEVGELAEEPGPDGVPGSGMWYGLHREVIAGDGDDGQVIEREYRPGAHPVLKEYGAERDRLTKIAAAAHTAGAEQAAINVAQALGAGIHQLFDEIFRALDLTPGQWERVPKVVPGILERYDPDAGEAAAQ